MHFTGRENQKKRRNPQEFLLLSLRRSAYLLNVVLQCRRSAGNILRIIYCLQAAQLSHSLTRTGVWLLLDIRLVLFFVRSCLWLVCCCLPLLLESIVVHFLFHTHNPYLPNNNNNNNWLYRSTKHVVHMCKLMLLTPTDAWENLQEKRRRVFVIKLIAFAHWTCRMWEQVWTTKQKNDANTKQKPPNRLQTENWYKNKPIPIDSSWIGIEHSNTLHNSIFIVFSLALDESNGNSEKRRII